MMIKIERLFFYLLVFSLPFQRRMTTYSFSVEFNEWSSAFLYFTDVVLGVIFFLWLWRLPEDKIIFDKTDCWLLSFLGVVCISLSVAQNLTLGLYQGLKLLEFALLFFYVKYNFSRLFNFERLLQVVVASGLFQALLAISQFFFQKDLGLLRIFGESIIGPQVAGVAKIDMPGFEILRAYGTFPHSNPLALFLFITLACLVCLFFLKNYTSFKARIFFVVASFILILSFLLTFSRAITALAALALLFYLILSKNKLLPMILLINVILLSWLLYPELTHRYDPVNLLDSQAVNFRIFYNQLALAMIKSNPLLGVGAGNFVWRSADFWASMDLIKYTLKKDGVGYWVFQPAHNVFLLIAAETGLLGLATFLIFLFLIIRKVFVDLPNPSVKICFMFGVLCFTVLLSIDHYLWTLQQGSLLLWISLGLLAGRAIAK